MSAAGERLNELLDDLMHPMEGMDPVTTPLALWDDNERVLLVPTPPCVYGVNVVMLASIQGELVDLLYNEPRDPGEVNEWKLLALGMAMGLAMRAARPR